MVRAELDQPRQRRQRDLLGEMLLDVLRQLVLLPAGQPAAQLVRRQRAAVVHARKLMRERDAERLDVSALRPARIELRLELDDGRPEIGVEEEQARPKRE